METLSEALVLCKIRTLYPIRCLIFSTCLLPFGQENKLWPFFCSIFCLRSSQQCHIDAAFGPSCHHDSKARRRMRFQGSVEGSGFLCFFGSKRTTEQPSSFGKHCKALLKRFSKCIRRDSYQRSEIDSFILLVILKIR